MGRALSLFSETFSTLLAVMNPLFVLPIYLELLEGKDEATHLKVARRACLYALLLCFFFLAFGTLILALFGVPLAMVRIVGGIILMRIGFSLFMPQKSDAGASAPESANLAFVPLAMPLMVGPGAIATIIGMTATIEDSSTEILSFLAISAAIVATILLAYLCLVDARRLVEKVGPLGIDAITRLIGFFLSAIGVGLIFNGTIEALKLHGLTTLH
jgi:multiple antibiotic resistance protein